jgi:hypothetical protein
MHGCRWDFARPFWLAARGIAAEILFAQQKDWSGKPVFLRAAQKTRPYGADCGEETGLFEVRSL